MVFEVLLRFKSDNYIFFDNHQIRSDIPKTLKTAFYLIWSAQIRSQPQKLSDAQHCFPEKYEIPENNGDHFIQQDEHMKNEDQVFHETFDNTLNTTNEMDMPNGQSAAQIVPDGDQIPTGNYSSSRHPDEIHHSPLTSPDSQQPLRQALSASGQNIGNPVSPSVTAESFNYYVAGKDGRQPEDAEYYDDPRERYVSTN